MLPEHRRRRREKTYVSGSWSFPREKRLSRNRWRAHDAVQRIPSKNPDRRAADDVYARPGTERFFPPKPYQRKDTTPPGATRIKRTRETDVVHPTKRRFPGSREKRSRDSGARDRDRVYCRRRVSGTRETEKRTFRVSHPPGAVETNSKTRCETRRRVDVRRRQVAFSYKSRFRFVR